jgi:hypothetical protein
VEITPMGRGTGKKRALPRPSYVPEPRPVHDRDDNPRLVRIGLRQDETSIAGVPEEGKCVIHHLHRHPELAGDGETLPQPEQDLPGNGLLRRDQDVVPQ